MAEPQAQSEQRPEPIEPGTLYTVQEGDNIYSIARRAYNGQDKLWQKINAANGPVIGKNPNILDVGTQLFIPNNPRRIQIALISQCCTVTAPEGLNARAQPNVESAIVASFPQGTLLCFDFIEFSECIDGTCDWGYSSELNCYFWMGGTDCP